MAAVNDDAPRVAQQDADSQSLRIWLNLLKCTNLIEERIGRHLKAEFNTRLRSFDVLAQIDREPANPTLGELSRRLMVTTGNVTSLIDRLERDGLVERRPLPNDRRSQLVRLTPAGKSLLDRMLPAHNRQLAGLLEDLGAAKRGKLEALLRDLRDCLSPAPD